VIAEKTAKKILWATRCVTPGMHRVDVDVLLSDETDYEGSIDNDDDLSSDDDPDARKLDSDVRCSVFPSSVAFLHCPIIIGRRLTVENVRPLCDVDSWFF